MLCNLGRLSGCLYSNFRKQYKNKLLIATPKITVHQHTCSDKLCQCPVKRTSLDILCRIVTQDRIRYTQKLLSEQPWISPANLQLFLLGWDAAEEWRDRSDTADRRELVQAWRTDYTPTAPSNSVMLQTRSADARRKIRELEAAIRTLEANKERGEPWPDGVISAGVASD